MKAKLNNQNTHATVLARANKFEDQPQPAALWTMCKTRMGASLLVVLTSAGCVTSNYDFDELSNASAPTRMARLSEDWIVEKNHGKDDSLYDVVVLPLAHTSLNVYSEADEDGIPEGFVEAHIDAYLPLFGFLDVNVKRYDTDHELYEQQEYSSYLWGLFQTHRELIETELGLREEKRRRLLWFFGWKSSPRYAESGYSPNHSDQLVLH